MERRKDAGREKSLGGKCLSVPKGKGRVEGKLVRVGQLVRTEKLAAAGFEL